jgi:AraC family transcriptional regulator of adaptative response/methylated-DNA-[protein]-cysteine methyltransferase
MELSDSLWQAIQTKDKNYDGQFYFGVATTKIFCHPSCPSRAALRKNIRIFETVLQAESQGYRACKKCNPKKLHNQIEDVVIALCRYIEIHAASALSLKALSEKSGYSASHIQKAFVKTVGISPKEYQNGLRQKNLKKHLKNKLSISDALHEAGYTSASQIYDKSASSLGMTPKQYLTGASGMDISYKFATTSVGNMLIGASDKGICFLQFGELQNQLLERLQDEFPSARLHKLTLSHQPLFEKWMDSLNAYLESREKLMDLPLDIKGTAFQLTVWNYLKTIPNGEVRSYTEVANALGKPKAIRAVASACAKNTIGLLIPCHRVIRGDGTLAGYRWGIERKKALLELEKAMA